MPANTTLRDWDDLVDELDLWAAEGRVASFWFRDDDAAEPGPALTTLCDLTEEFGVDLALAVVPALAVEALAEALDGSRHVAVIQHGYAHRNHAAAGEPGVECGGARPVDAVLSELRAGYERAASLFGSRFAPILAAPWNRISPPVGARVAELDFSGVSVFGPRAGAVPVPGLVMVNAHVDPLDWKRGGRFAGRDKALSSVIGELKARRTGMTERDEPLGLLTHHRDHDADAWDFLERLLRLTRAHPAAQWLRIGEAFGTGRARGAAASVATP